jgi:predicted Na+-dependent transporter
MLTVARMTILFPVVLGIQIRSLFPEIVGRSGPTPPTVAGIMLLILFLFVMTITNRFPATMDLWPYFVMATVVTVSIATAPCSVAGT